ncbi:MAG TPA: M48 family metallopeptidase [Candidatus Acidoferrum sp.]|nr:M48 family metallopeptidase [Candidatus Acidoferrum sp.]
MLRRLLLILVFTLGPGVAQTPAPPPPQREVKGYSLPPEKLQKAVEFARARNRLHFAGVAWDILMLLVLLGWRVAPRFRDWAEAVSRRRIVQAYIFVPLMVLCVDGLSLPTSIYSQHLSLKYEQSVQSWGSWFWDWTKGELIGMVIAGALVWILYGVIRRSPRRWWFYYWLASVPLLIFLLFITPVVINPLFNKFEPLAGKQPALVTEIERVVHRGGLEIPRDRMFEMNASEKMNSLNAYVTGFGASKRVVVWDTTIKKLTTGETLFVFGHEMGHYVLDHVWMEIGINGAMLLIFLFLGYHATNWVLARWGARWSIRGADDWASLTLFLLALSVFSFLSEPVLNSFSRVLEHNADVYGLEVIHGIVPNSSQVAASAFQILGEVGLADPNPDPFIEFWLYSHPSVSDRTRFALEYDPWGRGQPTKYVR